MSPVLGNGAASCRSTVPCTVHRNVLVPFWFTFLRFCHQNALSEDVDVINYVASGYQLLMSHGILSIACYNGWSSSMKHSHRRRSHWILQLAGSILAIAGSVIMIRHKSVNFNTVHGKLALAALTLTCISLFNGVMTLYKVGIGSAVSSQAFKISHLIIGSSAFAVSSVCLSFGFIKESFTHWSSIEFAYIMIGITSTYTAIIVLKPCVTIISKLTNKIKSKIC